MLRKIVLGLGVSVGLLGASASARAAEAKCTIVKDAKDAKDNTKLLRIGTPAAPDSPWGQVFKTWKKAVEQKTTPNMKEDGSTKCEASIDYYFNSTQGSESTMIDKMKAGQIDGAGVTSTGLGKIDKRLLTMQMPGLLRSWKTVDAVRAKVASKYEGFLAEKKITVIAWADVGYAHFLSKGFQVKNPNDLVGKSPWVYSEDPILKSVYAQIQGVNPYPAELMQVLPNIDNGKINCMSVSALAAEMLQWNSKFDHAVDQVNGIVVGGLIVSTDALDKMGGDIKAAYLETSKAMSNSEKGLKQRIRNEDAAAWVRFTGRTGVVIYKPTADDTAAWNKVFVAARESLKKGTFDPGLVSDIETTAAANQ